MRNSTLTTIGAIAALGSAFAIAPAMSDGPPNFDSLAGQVLHDGDAAHTQRQTDTGPGIESADAPRLAADQAYRDGFTDGFDLRDRLARGEAIYTSRLADEQIDVQAHRLPNGARVAVRGTVTAVSGEYLVLQRGEAKVQARLPGRIDQISGGDDVTVYGRLTDHGGDVTLRSDAVLLMTRCEEGRLFLAPSKLETVNKRNSPLTRAAARNALDYYRFNFTPL